MKNILVIFALIGSIAGFSFGRAQIIYAEETEDAAETTTESDEDKLCALNMATAGELALNEYITFLEEYFKMDKPTSEQIEDGITRYRYYIEDIKAAFELNSVPVGGKTIDRNLDAYTICESVENEYLEFGKNLLTVFSETSANSKRTYKVVDAMKAINANMSDFSQEFSGVFPQLLQKMDNALPCYAKSCTTK